MREKNCEWGPMKSWVPCMRDLGMTCNHNASRIQCEKYNYQAKQRLIKLKQRHQEIFGGGDE